MLSSGWLYKQYLKIEQLMKQQDDAVPQHGTSTTANELLFGETKGGVRWCTSHVMSANPYPFSLLIRTLPPKTKTTIVSFPTVLFIETFAERPYTNLPSTMRYKSYARAHAVLAHSFVRACSLSSAPKPPAPRTAG